MWLFVCCFSSRRRQTVCALVTGVHTCALPISFAANWLARQKDMVEKYRPDMVYLDDTGLPFGSYGIEALAHYYAQGRDADGGLDVVLTAKKLTDYQRGALVEDVERGFSDRLRAEPWQTCTCIGEIGRASGRERVCKYV